MAQVVAGSNPAAHLTYFLRMSFTDFISILIGYLLGSISPSYFLTYLIKKQDIRFIGERNAGTRNVYLTVGLLPAIITAVIDVSKGVLAVIIGQIMGANPLFCNLSGLAAIAGHAFPFYLKFRGGQGLATSSGLLLYYIYKLTTDKILTPEVFAFLAFFAGVALIISHTEEVVSFFTIPFLSVASLMRAPTAYNSIFFSVVSTYVILRRLINITTRKRIKLQKPDILKKYWWRVALRPGALAFVYFYESFSKTISLAILSAVAACFIIMDMTRFLSKKTRIILHDRVTGLFKKTEHRKLSSMTYFLVGALIVLGIFPPHIAFPAFTYTIFGDMFGKLVGLTFGRRRIFQKTLEGSLTYLATCMFISFILWQGFGYALPYLLIGSLTAAITELLPLPINDNLTAQVLSAVSMYLVTFF